MQVFILNSVYTSPTEVSDLSDDFLDYQNPLYIGAREAQVYRVNELLNGSDFISGEAKGYWELKNYFDSAGNIIKHKFKEHDAIFMASPVRVEKSKKELYGKLILDLREL